MPRPWPAVGGRPIYPLLTATPEVLILWLLAAIGDSGGSVCVASLGAWQSRWSLPNSSDSSGNRRRGLARGKSRSMLLRCGDRLHRAVRRDPGRGAVVMEGQVVLLSGDAGLASTIGRLLSDGDRIARYYSAELADWSTPRQAHPGGQPGRRVEQGAGRQRKLHRVANAQAHRGSAVATPIGEPEYPRGRLVVPSGTPDRGLRDNPIARCLSRPQPEAATCVTRWLSAPDTM
jgi:hypothetical protein